MNGRNYKGMKVGRKYFQCGVSLLSAGTFIHRTPLQGGGGCVFSAPPIHYPLLRVLKFYRSRDIIGQVSPFARSSVTDRSVHWLLRVKPFVMSNGSDAVKFKLAYL